MNATEQAGRRSRSDEDLHEGDSWIPGSVMMRMKFFQPTLTTKPGATPAADEVTFRIDVLVEAGVTVGQHQSPLWLSYAAGCCPDQATPDLSTAPSTSWV